jgi:iron complex transport system substrate-binding protein
MKNPGRSSLIPYPSSLIFVLALSCAEPAPPPKTANRVISLAPNITELLSAVGCRSKIVGTDNFSNVPNAVKLGGVEPDLEKIVALKPDLVIASASAAHPNLRRGLAALHIPLLIIKTERLDDMTKAMADVAKDTACDPRAAIGAFQRAINASRRTRVKQPRILFTVWTDPMYVAGRDTFIDDLYHVAGATNAAEVTGWPQYSLESFVAHPPDILLYPDHSVTPEAVAALAGRAHLNIRAVAVDEDAFTHPGPRLTDAVAQLNRICDEWERAH